MFEKYDKKLFISKRHLALSIFVGIFINVSGVGLCVAAIHHMNITSNLDAPETLVERPLAGR